MNIFIFILSLALSGFSFSVSAQENARIYRSDLPDINIDSTGTLHIISPEPIRYVDISTHSVIGDLPEENVLRLKWVPDSGNRIANHSQNLGIVTIIGESFIAQYQLHFRDGMPDNMLTAGFNILTEHMRPLQLPIELTAPELRSHALSLLAKRDPAPRRKEKAYGIQAELNHVYTVGDLIFLDISYRNNTNLSYDIDEMHFKIEDRKITKATNIQSIDIKPVWQLYPNNSFKKNYRNIYVLKKATFPASKVLSIELSEKQISGRTITLKIRYKDILEADSF